MTTLNNQSRRKIWKSRGESSNVLGIFVPPPALPIWIELTILPKSGGPAPGPQPAPTALLMHSQNLLEFMRKTAVSQTWTVIFSSGTPCFLEVRYKILIIGKTCLLLGNLTYFLSHKGQLITNRLVLLLSFEQTRLFKLCMYIRLGVMGHFFTFCGLLTIYK